MEENKEKKYNEEDPYEEEFVEDVEFIQDVTLKGLEKKIRKKLEEGGTIEQNPFLDTTGEKPMWTQMILYYGPEEEEEA